jgi:pyruvate formate lyase activating enzyme
LSAAQTIAERAPRLRVGGLTAFSATDYPDSLAAVVFCQGCPWRCGYCHNPHLLPAQSPRTYSWEEIRAFLERRVGLLEAVVFSGGEPLAQRGLPDAMRQVKRMGFRVGLHTGGAYPSRLAEALPLVDWIGLDVKADFADYARVTAVPGSGDNAQQSVKLVIASGVAHEIRTTVHSRFHDAAALERLAIRLAALGVRHYVVQEFRAEGCANIALRDEKAPTFLTDAWCNQIAPRFASLAIRRAESSWRTG